MIPYRNIDAVFFDAGGTLVGVDFDWVSEELGRLGVPCEAEELARAEAAVRPRMSERLAGDDPLEDPFKFFLESVLTKAFPVTRHRSVSDLVAQLAPILHPDGKGQRLWSAVPSGTRDALIEFSRLGLRMAVVSNSDGTLQESLKALGLERFFDAVIDSEVVGYAKPDRRIFELALQAVGTEAGRTVHVGDMYFADVVGARAAGLHPVLLDPYGHWGEVDCVRVASLAELGTKLQGRHAIKQPNAAV